MSVTTSDVTTLQTIFAMRPALHRQYLESVLESVGTVSKACEYLSNVPDSEVPSITALSSRRSASSNSWPSQATETQFDVDWSDQEAVGTMLEVSTSIIVPSIRDRFCGLPLPDIDNSDNSTDRFKYSLANIIVTSFSLHENNVRTQVHDGTIDIIADDIDVEVAIGNWSYRMRFPPVKDNGEANLSFRGLKTCVTVRYDNDNVSLSECSCQVRGGVNFRTGDSRLSWFYNSVASVARGAIRHNVEIALQNALRQSLEEQLQDWSSWVAS